MESGELLAHIAGRELKAPVHLIQHGETLFIGALGTGSILALDLTSTPLSGELKARVVIDGKLDAPSGFAVGPTAIFTLPSERSSECDGFRPTGRKKGRSLMTFRTCQSSSSMFPEKSQCALCRLLTTSGSGECSQQSSRTIPFATYT